MTTATEQKEVKIDQRIDDRAMAVSSVRDLAFAGHGSLGSGHRRRLKITPSTSELAVSDITIRERRAS